RCAPECSAAGRGGGAGHPHPSPPPHAGEGAGTERGGKARVRGLYGMPPAACARPSRGRTVLQPHRTATGYRPVPRTRGELVGERVAQRNGAPRPPRVGGSAWHGVRSIRTRSLPACGGGLGWGPAVAAGPVRRARRGPTTQKPASRRVFAAPARAGDPRWPRCRVAVRSLDLAFLVDHVLADDGIVLLDLHLPGGVLLVLVRGVEVAGAGRRNQADLVALGCHGVLLLRPSRHACAARRGRRR